MDTLDYSTTFPRLDTLAYSTTFPRLDTLAYSTTCNLVLCWGFFHPKYVLDSKLFGIPILKTYHNWHNLQVHKKTKTISYRSTIYHSQTLTAICQASS